MHNKEWLLDTLTQAGFETSLCSITDDPITEHHLGKFAVSVRTELSDDFPYVLPKYHLVNRGKHGALAHVSWGTDEYADICFGSSAAFNLNYDAPEKIVIHGLEKACSVLSRVLNDPNYNESELKREFVSIWDKHVSRSDLGILCLAEPSEDIHELQIRKPISDQKSRLQKQIIAVCPKTSACNPNYFLKNESDKTRRHNEGKGVLVPLVELIEPPAPDEHIKDWWINLLQAQPDQLKMKLRQYARHNKASDLYIVCRAPVETGHVWFAVHSQTQSKQQIPLADKFIEGWSFNAYSVDAIAKENLLSRGGAKEELNSFHIGIIGCGSVGVYVADMLASSGIGKLTLIDPETLMIENTHRHYLGSHWLYCQKVSGLKYSLQDQYPFVEIQTETNELLSYRDKDKLDQFDLLIITTGNATHERAFNQFIVSKNIEIPTVYGWVEAYGVGGHAVAVQPNQNGCLDCIYIDKSTNEAGLHPYTNYIEQGQNVISNHAGCGTDYLSYSNIDATQTAAIVAKLALRTLTKEINESVSVSWKGSEDLAHSHDIELAHRFHRSRNVLNEIPVAHEGCNVCS